MKYSLDCLQAQENRLNINNLHYYDIEFICSVSIESKCIHANEHCIVLTFLESGFHKYTDIELFESRNKCISSHTYLFHHAINVFRRQLAKPRVDDRMVSARMHYSRHYRIAFGMTVRLTYNKIPPEINLLYVSCVQIKF